jgi:hypothetical protein
MDGRSTLTWYSSTRIDPELFRRKINTMLWLDRQPEEMVAAVAAIRPVRPSPTRLDIPADSPAKCLPCSTLLNQGTDSCMAICISAVISDVLFEFDLAETLVARHTGSSISIVTSHRIDMHVVRNIPWIPSNIGRCNVLSDSYRRNIHRHRHIIAFPNVQTNSNRNFF